MAVNPCCKIEVCDSGYVVSLEGRCTLQQSPAFRDFAYNCLDSGLNLSLDLSECELLDSTFLGCLIGVHKRSLELGKSQFRVFAHQECRLHLLSTSGLHRLFDFVDELPDTIGDCLSLEFRRVDTSDLGRHVMHTHRLLAGIAGEDAEKFRSIADRLQQELDRPSAN